jgi:D-3-phosphoglycerate dehydrogenase
VTATGAPSAADRAGRAPGQARPPRQPDWGALTMRKDKARLFAREPQLAESWEDVEAAWGESAEQALGRVAVLMMKPEAVARRCVDTALTFAVDNGFTPVASSVVGLSREHCHSLWRYQWNKATTDRLRLQSFVGEQRPCFLTVLRDDAPEDGVPASVRLWGLKGATDAAKRHAGHLRSVLGMSNRMIGFAHTPDEPADILRELGILFDTDRRRELVESVLEGLELDRTRAVIEAARALQTRFPAYSLDLDEVVGRRAAANGSFPMAAVLDAVRERRAIALDEVRAAFGTLETDQDIWDYIVLASELIEPDRPGVEAILDAGAFATVRARWAAGAGPPPPYAGAAGGAAAATPAARHARPRVLVVDPVHDYALQALGERFDLTVDMQPPEPALTRLLRDADVLVLRSGVKVPGSMIRSAPRLRLIARAGVGVDNIDLRAARERGIAVFNVPATTSVSTAEFTFGLLMAVGRKIALADRQLRANVWDKPRLYGAELHGKRIGIVGCGRIGTRVAEIAHGFGMEVLACVANPTADRRRALSASGIEVTQLDDLLARADFVTLHVPLTDRCRGLIGARELALMRPTAHLIDVSRGGVVDEDDLHEALSCGQIAGAAKDVFVCERTRTRLAELDNAVVTPHIGSMTTDAQERVARILVASIVDFLDGREIGSRVC